MNTEQKIDAIFKGQTEMKIELARFMVHQENHAKTLSEHDKDIKEFNDYKNQQIGKTSIISLIFGSVGALIMFMIKYLTSPHE